MYFLLILPDFDGLGTKPNWNKWEPSTIPHTKMAHSAVNRDLARLSVNSYWNINIGSVIQTSIKLWLSPCHGTVQVLIHVLLIGYICPTKNTHDFLCFFPVVYWQISILASFTGIKVQSSGIRVGLFNTQLHLEILQQDYIAKPL